MKNTNSWNLPKGLISVVQTPFYSDDKIDVASLERLLEDAIKGGVNGFLAPAVASEVAFLTQGERITLVKRISEIVNKRIALIVGASSSSESEVKTQARFAMEINATAYLVAVPDHLYDAPQAIVPFFQSISSECSLPLIIQDLQWNSNGLPLSIMSELWEAIPTLAGFKIETVPAGPKYTRVREKLGGQVFLCGGWAIPQMIESFDRGIDAMIPESSMIRVYRAIIDLYQKNQRRDALDLFNRLLPVLSYTNQELTTSIAFFKRLLVRKAIFSSARLRMPDFEWDQYNIRVADDLIELYLEIEEDIHRFT